MTDTTWAEKVLEGVVTTSIRRPRQDQGSDAMTLRKDPSQWMHPDDRKSDMEWEREEQDYRGYLQDAEPTPSWFFPPYKEPQT